MGALAAAVVGALLASGGWLVVVGTLRRPPATSPGSSTGLWKRVEKSWARQSPRRRVVLGVSMAFGVVVAAVSGWLIAIPVIPIAVIGLPKLLSAPREHELETLTALDRWVRLVAASISTGKSIRDAILATRGSAPAVLREPLQHLGARVDQGWSVSDALLAMADDLDSADADAVLAAMAIAAGRGGTGSRAALDALGENIQERIKVLRDVATERAKPRAVVRQVTIITLVVLAGALLLGRGFFEPYSSPLGQALVAVLAAAYIGSLVMLRHRTSTKPTARFLQASR